jgi:3-hydroxyisobutyrate dehydrogenase-like beta-hydroxyacid dehydrogenase
VNTRDVGAAHPFPSAVGFIGLGVMGLPMAAQLLDAASAAGACLRVFSRRRSSAEELIARGAVWADSAKQIGQACDVVVVMVPDLPQVEEVLNGTNGLVAGVRTPSFVAVGSTVSPQGLQVLAAHTASNSNDLVHLVDAPVSGGEEGAQDGSLSIMVGGDDSDVAAVWPVLAAMGIPAHFGSIGSGQIAKACNQIVVAATLLALGEAAVLAERSDLDVGELFDVLQNGLAGSRVLETKRDRFVTKDYRPSGRASFMAKDLVFAVAEARRTGLAAPHLELLSATFGDLTKQGFGDQDTSVVRAYIEAQMTTSANSLTGEPPPPER